MHPDDRIAELVSDLDMSVGRDKQKAVALYHEYRRSLRAEDRLDEWNKQPSGNYDCENDRRDLLPLLLMAEDRFAEVPRQWPRIFRRMASRVRSEHFVEMRPVGMPSLRRENEPLARDNAPGERFVYRIDAEDYGLQTAVVRDGDGIAMSALAPQFLGMVNSFAQMEEIRHAKVLNDACIYDTGTVGDGLSLCSDKHPIDNGTYSNLIKERLDYESLSKAALAVSRFPDQAGLWVGAKSRILVVPTDLEWCAQSLREVPREGYMVLDFLQKPDAWFLITTINGLVSTEYRPFRLDLRVEGNNLVLEGTQSYGVGHYNPRAVIGSFPGGTDGI